ncbi:MAG: nicotinate-nucleotide--dimethylbenzimidazole phosphoribosyltransferase [Bradyrhizobium sp.]|uniref:nicotinate-nucleotide--dimethylbenzimidazole phosphoribosyltransferase n=1 Tax=Bradyrhizobium sp. TaxID=376 RepID=UPI001C29AA37|nr:nicotinate-nucleotide--dimethylbenzimidazole phosphoribosyltransferase [Bradyrhizobium sp.]MBU6461992.1 nicotinate-nucleotide--dimethylbenzimidazole phosphoribosyltransferase [Pseudomonadota bacterium]MDE2066089.1 nicotinate-nucleotide--dimethylbenzimidazole phosphoribosyltransferase [Bradyrhizobium sp.]MDE2240977.1 nicotinate-nucleotide--dimethylbenzimidazole phosphoribosyltransferase [Bradyrhizobium sp.]
MDTKTPSAALTDWPIEPVDPSLEPRLRARIDGKAKPLGALGRLEDLAVQLGSIWHPLLPRAKRATVFVFAADHGITAEGISLYPASVTAAMVATYLAGRAGVSALARACDVNVQVVDAGVDANLPAHPELIDAKIRRGSRNAVHEPALTIGEVGDCLTRGASIVADSIEAGTDIVAIGEMGIGNTTSAALLMHRLAPVPLANCVGAGAGLDAAGIARKLAVAERAVARSSATSSLEVLAEFGGYEIAMMAGAVLGSAMHRRPVVIDGFIASAAALVAVRLQPAARGYCVFSHSSAERGHRALLDALGAKPYLDLGLRLGEGTGAVMAVPLLRAASGILTEMADLSDVMAGTLQPWRS